MHRSAFIATETAFYMMHDDHVLRFDPETGAELGQIRVPNLDGSLKWMAKLGNVCDAQGRPPTMAVTILLLSRCRRG